MAEIKYIVYCEPNSRGLGIRLVADETRPLDGEIIKAHKGRFTEADVSRFRQIAAELNAMSPPIHDVTSLEFQKRLSVAMEASTNSIEGAIEHPRVNGWPCICPLCVSQRPFTPDELTAAQDALYRVERYCQGQIDRNSDEALLWAQCRKIALDALRGIQVTA